MKHRILFYSHDTFGLGHFRRSLTIASYLTRHLRDVSVLMLTGLDTPASFEQPAGVDFVKLPAIWKAGPDQYRSRHLRVSFNRVRRIRRNLIRTVTRAFDPALMVVDNVPRGAGGELLPTLRFLREQRPHTPVVLTLRDVLDSPENIVPKWREQGVYDVLKEFYQEIWVTGCQPVFDPIALYELPCSVAAKVKFCGYVVRSSTPTDAENLEREFRLQHAPLVVASCGGGGDGYRLMQTYVNAMETVDRKGLRSAVFLGPDMPPIERQELKRRLLPMSDRFMTFDFRADLVAFVQASSACVCMGGYNTVCELVALRKPAVVVPRTYPRLEQLLRANALADLGLLRVLQPEQLTPENLRAALLQLLDRVPHLSPLPAGVDFAGLTRITRRVRKLLALNGAASGHRPASTR